MNLMKKVVLVVWAAAWLLSISVKDDVVSFADEMRVMQGRNDEPVSVAVFIASLAAGAGIIGFTGVLIAVLKVN